MGRDRNESGRYNDRIDPATVLEVFDARDDQSRPLTASDIVDALGIARRTAHNKLNALVERGELETRKVGARGRVWWVPSPTGNDQDGTRDTAQSAESAPAVERDPSPADADQDDTRAESDGEDPVDALDLPGSGGKLDARRDAIRQMYGVLRDHAGEPVGKDALLDVVDPDAVGYGSAGSFWGNCVTANTSQGRETNALVALPGVEDWGGGEYRYNP